MKIVKMLNELYTIFDALCDTKRIPNIYKVSRMLCAFDHIKWRQYLSFEGNLNEDIKIQ